MTVPPSSQHGNTDLQKRELKVTAQLKVTASLQ